MKTTTTDHFTRRTIAYVLTATATIVVILLLTFSGLDFLNITNTNFKTTEFVIPIVQLQTNHNIQAVIASDRLHVTRNRTLTMQKRRRRRLGRAELELGRARATIRIAASVGNISQLYQNGDVLSPGIFHNPAEFYQ
ncbi:hypothetical protein Tco_0543033 [Tanacetum coccineum]